MHMGRSLRAELASGGTSFVRTNCATACGREVIGSLEDVASARRHLGTRSRRQTMRRILIALLAVSLAGMAAAAATVNVMHGWPGEQAPAP